MRKSNTICVHKFQWKLKRVISEKKKKESHLFFVLTSSLHNHVDKLKKIHNNFF